MSVTHAYTGTLSVVTCCNCGMAFGMPQDYQRRRRNDHEMFYCPAGHPQHYTGKPTEEGLRERLEAANRRTAAAVGQAKRERDRANGYKGAMRKVKKRVAHGVCPCCTRTFRDLAAHMKTKHADYVEGERG